MGWRRVGAGTAPLVIGAVMLALGTIPLSIGVTVIVAEDAPVVWLVIALLAGAAYLAFSCRLLMIGTYVSATGLRVRTPLHTWTFAWSAVLSVRSRKITRMVSVHRG